MKVTKTVNFFGGVECTNEHGHLHREDGPAVIASIGSKYWYINGHLHREDGPAVILAKGDKVYYYYLNGIPYSYEHWLELIPNKIMYKWREYCGSK